MKLRDHLAAIFDRLGRIDANLDEHMRRTEAAEDRLRILELDVKPVLSEFDKRAMRNRDFQKAAITAVVAALVTLLTKFLATI